MNTMSFEEQVPTAGQIHWRRSILWLLFLAPFFFMSYGFANGHAERMGATRAVYFAWERQIPFIPWTIVPYWSIDLFYGLSFLMCRTPRMVNRHALRLLTIQLVSVACFILFPLHFAFDRPDTSGLFGAMFDTLMGFDKPYNQAPSLHIGLLVVIWMMFAQGTQGAWRWLTHLWGFLIGVSVLTTYQHHFIDIPTGMAVGFSAAWLWPDQGQSLSAGFQLTRNPQRLRMAFLYGAGSTVLSAVAALCGGVWLWLFWPALSLVIVALNYLAFGAAGFQKQRQHHSVAVRVLCWPYLAVAWLNSRWWTRNNPAPVNICENVWLGRMPSDRDMENYGMEALCDVTAELPAPGGSWRSVHLSWLDLITPSSQQLRAAAQEIESFHTQGKVLVCCALGLSRSACAVAAWLLVTGRAGNVDEAIAAIRSQRPCIVLQPPHYAVLAACHAEVVRG
jgi:protein-tyrosine phosphatase